MITQYTHQQLSEMKANGTATDDVINVYYRYLTAREWHNRHFARSAENWAIYSALDPELGLGQWPEESVAYMQSQRRQLTQYNITKPTIDLLAGSMVQAPFDPDFIPINSEITSLTEVIKKAMYSDKEICDWGSAYFELVRAGLVFEGVLKMEIDDTWDDLGNIKLSYCLPHSWFGDPMWKTPNTKDCRRCYHEQWLMPDQLQEYYGDRAPNLEFLLSMYERGKFEYGPHSGVVPFRGDDGRWGTAVQCVHEYRMIKERRATSFIATEQGNVEIPAQLQDAAEVIDWLNKSFGFEGWQPDAIYEKPEIINTCIKTTIAPALSMFTTIDERAPEVQIGQIPFFVWSADRINGEPHSVVDQVKDPQRTINYWHSLIQHKIQTEGGGGAKFIERNGFANAEEFERARENYNDPTELFEVKPNQNPIRPIINSQFNPDVYNHLDRIINVMWPMISKTTPAGRGQVENSNESGYLYNLKVAQSQAQGFTMHYTLRQFWNQVYTGYLSQAAQQYSAGGLPRVFSIDKGKETVTLNEKISLPDGSIGIRNDARKLKEIRHKVIVSDVQQSPSKNMEDIQILSEMLKAIPPTKPATIAYITAQIAKKVNQLDAESKDELEQIGEIELEAELLRLQLVTLQTQQQIQAITNPAPPAQVIPQGPAGSGGGQPIQQIPQGPPNASQ
jgi:hypothetical protein